MVNAKPSRRQARQLQRQAARLKAECGAKMNSQRRESGYDYALCGFSTENKTTHVVPIALFRNPHKAVISVAVLVPPALLGLICNS